MDDRYLRYLRESDPLQNPPIEGFEYPNNQTTGTVETESSEPTETTPAAETPQTTELSLVDEFKKIVPNSGLDDATIEQRLQQNNVTTVEQLQQVKPENLGIDPAVWQQGLNNYVQVQQNNVIQNTQVNTVNQNQQNNFATISQNQTVNNYYLCQPAEAAQAQNAAENDTTKPEPPLDAQAEESNTQNASENGTPTNEVDLFKNVFGKLGWDKYLKEESIVKEEPQATGSTEGEQLDANR